MLLGVLAQVDKALSPFAAAPEPALEQQADLPFGDRDQAAAGIPDDYTGHVSMSDVGVAVSREDTVMAESNHVVPILTTKEKETEPVSKRKPKLKEEEDKQWIEKDDDKPKSKKKKKAGEDEFDDIFDSLDKGDDRPKAKKKKKAVGDEFDDIFSSLDKSAKRPKMKRKKGGGEFDDIFGGL